MRIEYLRISNYRNIKSMELTPCSGANIIFGGNAQGKTNLLEAMWLFSGAKSFRGAKDTDVVLLGENEARLELGFISGNRSQTASIGIGGERKSVFQNEIKLDSITKLAGELCMVVFSPDHLSLVKQGPDKRRKFIDTSLCQAYPKYIKILDGYNRALKQRNALLREIAVRPSLCGTLDAWDEALLDYGSYITHMRARYVKKLAALAAGVYDGISSGKESFSAEYLSGCGEADMSSREDIRARFGESLIKNRSDDIKNCITKVGPHRDDIDITLDGLSARTYGSQGQQRSCILALKLAECGILEERNKEPPVILLDDVMSELDKNRRDFLLNRVIDKQVFMTCCDTEAFDGLLGGRVFEINGGVLSVGDGFI